MAQEKVSSVLVVEDGKLAGIITEKDLARKIVAQGLDAEITSANQIMTKNLVTVTSDTTLYDAMLLINRKKIKHLPVVINSEPVGIITAMDILRVQPSYMEVYSSK